MIFPNSGVEVNPALLLLLGFMVGTLSGFFGVGGGFLITGGLLVFGVEPVFAVGTGLAVIMGSSLINTLKHRRIGNVDFRLGALMVIGTIPGVFLAERLNSQLESWGLEGPVIRYTYVAFLAAMGSFVIYDYLKTRRSVAGTGTELVSTSNLARRIQSLHIPVRSIGLPGHLSLPTYVSLPTSRIRRISIWIPISVGFLVGFFAGLLGAGGGFLLMPILVYVVGVPTTVAVGTDLFQIVITGSVGTLLYSLSNRVDLLMAIIMLVSASAGSQVGVAASRYVDGARIRFLFGVTILSGCVAIALKQASETPGPEFLSTVSTVVLLAGSGAMCILIATMFVIARSKRRSTSPGENTPTGSPSGGKE